MNLRNAEDYTIGLDLGTGSVGWAVTDKAGDLYHIKLMPTLGARLFKSAETAASTRIKRGERRRYNRRRQRIKFLQGIFANEIEKIDPNFFIRMNMSSLVSEDKQKSNVFAADAFHSLFNETDFTESEYYKRFPTIWHLRKHLSESNEKEDIRLVYLALHNIVKYRGNFLHEGEKLTAANADATAAGSLLAEALGSYYNQLGDAGLSDISCCPNAEKIARALDKHGMKRSDRRDDLAKAFGLSNKTVADKLAGACVGYKTEFSDPCFQGLEKSGITKFSLDDDEKIEEFINLCPDDAQYLFECLITAYSAYILSSLLQGNQSISQAMISSYEQHGKDLSDIKGLIKDYCGIDTYREIFCGDKTKDGSYDINKLPKNSYTAYITGEKLASGKGCSQEDLVKNLREIIENINDSSVLSDARYKRIYPRLSGDEGDFLTKQKTRANGAIPYQLHLEEMEQIIDQQSAYYPFLDDNKEALSKIVSSRIPYYVGPLNAEPDPGNPFSKNPIDPTRKFGWSVRKEGMEHAKAYPWNIEEVIDLDETAKRFIERMTGTCTYLYGEKVLPRCSLLYEEFCVLNELNGARWSNGSSDPKRFDAADREGIMEELFKKHKSVSYKTIKEWLKKEHGDINVEITGAQGETGFVSKLESYNNFCKILNVPSLDDESCPLSIDDIETIILWNTVYEDRSILTRRLKQTYGRVLNERQIKSICDNRCNGWGNLSKEFLSGIKINTPLGRMGIIDVMRTGDPITGHHLQSMILMEVLTDKDLGFQELIDKHNKEYFEKTGERLSIDDMQGSPALRRSVNQAMRIIDEIITITGKPPARICIESTRDEDPEKQGKRTKTRFKNLKEALGTLKTDAKKFDPEILEELKKKENDLNDDRLMLYFAQCGKCLYSEKPLDINRLNEYQIDHILPQAYIKDDSLDNRALVLQSENQRKLDSLLLDNSIINARYTWWESLKNAGLISEKKFRNLTCKNISERRLTGFINRQLVETSQIVKFVRQMCEQRYPGTEVISIKASLTRSIRKECDLPKCRDLNDYHHAHDAYIACQAARFISIRYPHWQNGFDLNLFRKYIKSLSTEYKNNKRIPGSAGFIANSFMRDGFDKKTGEVFRDTWDAQQEIIRMKNVLEYKKVFLSRMPFEQTGAFWKETIYSPKDSKHKSDSLTPLKGADTKKELSTSKYGGYDKEQQAYFFIFVAEDKKGHPKYFFEGVPIHRLSVIDQSPDALQKYAEKIANDAGCSNAKILRSKVPLRQKFILNGDGFVLYGRSNKTNEIRPAAEITLPLSTIEKIADAIDGSINLQDEEFISSYRNIASKIALTNKKLFNTLKLEKLEEQALILNDNDRIKLIGNILRVANGESQGCDLSLVGKTKSIGYMLINIASNLPNIVWCDQSVTGIFEKQTTFEDLLNGI